MAIGTPSSLGSNKANDANLTVVLTVTDNASIGDEVFVFLGIDETRNWTQVQDSVGNVYTVDKSQSNATSGAVGIARTLVTVPIVSGSTTITGTVDGSGGTDKAIAACKVAGIASSPLDQTTGSSGSIAGWASGAINTGNANDIIFGVADISRNLTSSLPDSPWLELFDFQAAADSTLTVVYQIVSATGSYSASGTWAAAAQPWAALVAAYKGAAAAAASAPTAPRPRAFQEQGQIYSGEQTGFQPLAFQIPDPTRGFQENDAFQPQAFQKPDPTVAFQPEGFDIGSSFQMSVLAFQEPTGFQGDAFQESARQTVASATTNVTGVGAIASAEAFGPVRVVRIEAVIGIASAESFGTTRAVRIVSPVPGVATAEAFGATRAVRVLAPVAISSATAFGQVKLTRILGPVGLTSSESFGTSRVVRLIGPTGIASAQAFGAPDLLRFVGTTGIASATAFGTTRVLFVVYPLGIASSEAWGKPTETGGTYSNVYTVSGVGAIASATAFGITDVVRVLAPVAISSATAFGTPRSVFVLGPVGLSSSTAFGTTRAVRVIGPAGVSSAQALGVPSLPRLIQNAGAVASANNFGTTKATRVIYTLGVSSGQAFGTPTKSPQIVSPRGISTSEAFGTPSYVGPVLFGSAFGSVFLSEVSVYDVSTLSASVFGKASEDVARFSADSASASRFEGGIDDAGRFASVADDTPGV